MSATPTRVFVHGNPETVAIWRPVLSALGMSTGSHVVCLSPPGFGAPLPQGFGATIEDYRLWLVAEIEALGEPVDLIGHDFGGVHVLTVVMTRPDLVRSWVSDTCAVFEPDYEWHGLAQVWQTPGAGEEMLAGLFSGTVSERTQRLVELGVTLPAADHMALAQGQDMAQAILALYRSSRQPVLANLGRNLGAAAARPGLSLLATGDDFVGTVQQRRDAADRAHARTHVLEGCGHWWMLEGPAMAARALADFWASLAAGESSH